MFSVTDAQETNTIENTPPKYQCPCLPRSEGRNLVVCVDGTSNQYGEKNTNIIELYSRLFFDDRQQLYYNSGIGTYARPSWGSISFYKQVLENKIDLAIAWNFEKIIKGAYRWLSDQYKEGDRIYLFGFSRGAYQVRALAGMIEKVGLIHRGNEGQIPFAYELYAELNKKSTTQDDVNAAERFKSTFSTKGVRVHFVGVWDTVSSIGIVQGKTLPLTDSSDHICFFRHALALDECRVKFLPEYVAKVACCEEENAYNERVKEVWFPGSHSDVGGGNWFNKHLNLEGAPLLWMQNEAFLAGLRLQRSQSAPYYFNHLKHTTPHNSLEGIWLLLEWLPVRRACASDPSKTTRVPHKGQGRVILPGQKVHISVAYQPRDYRPKADFIGSSTSPDWQDIVAWESDKFEFTKGWARRIEMDIFDIDAVPSLVELLAEDNIPQADSLHILDRLSFLVGSGKETRLDSTDKQMMLNTEDKAMAVYHAPRIFETLERHATSRDSTVARIALQILNDLVRLESSTPNMTALDALITLPVHHDMAVNFVAVEYYEDLAANSWYRMHMVQLGAIPKLLTILKRVTAVNDPKGTGSSNIALALQMFTKHVDSRPSIINCNISPMLINLLDINCSWGVAAALVEIAKLKDEESRTAISKAIPTLMEKAKWHDHKRTLEFLINLARDKASQPIIMRSIPEPAKQLRDGPLGYETAKILLELAKHDDSRRMLIESKAVTPEMLGNRWDTNQADVLIELTTHADSRTVIIDMIPGLVKNLGTVASHDSATVILHLINYDESRQALLKFKPTLPGLVKSLSQERCIGAADSLIQLIKYEDYRMTIVHMIPSLVQALENKASDGGAIVVKELAKHDEARRRLITCGIIPIFTSMFNQYKSDIVAQVFIEIAAHRESRPMIVNIIPNLVKELQHYGGRQATAVLAELAKYDDSRPAVIYIIPALVRHLQDIYNSGSIALEELAKHDDSRAVLTKSKAISTLHKKVSSDYPESSAVNALAELEKHGESSLNMNRYTDLIVHIASIPQSPSQIVHPEPGQSVIRES